MKSRKEFVKQGALAVAAFLVAKPYSAFAGKSSFPEFLTGQQDKFKLIYTGKGLMLQNKSEYDIVFSKDAADNYTILMKDGIRTGFIHPRKDLSIENISRISHQLKENEQCRLVVCLSGQEDSVQLARKTNTIDIIICPKEKNFKKRAFTAFNRDKAEVIIHDINHSSADQSTIEITFDQQQRKRQVVHY